MCILKMFFLFDILMLVVCKKTLTYELRKTEVNILIKTLNMLN